MNREFIAGQPSFFTPRNTKQREIEKCFKDVRQFNRDIYKLSWEGFHKELHKLGVKKFLQEYRYSCKRQLQLLIAKSKLSEKRITLYDFEKSTEQVLRDRLGNDFFAKITPNAKFNAKNHKLSTIHYYMYRHSLTFTAISLGFSSKQSFLNFFAQTSYIPEHMETITKNLEASIQSLHEVDPVTLREELADLYDKPLAKNKNFIKYNFTLLELKLALENEDIALVVASLGGNNLRHIDQKLQVFGPFANVSLQSLKRQSWASLKAIIPGFISDIKLYQLFSRQIALEYGPYLNIPRSLPKSDISFQWQFQPTVCSKPQRGERR